MPSGYRESVTSLTELFSKFLLLPTMNGVSGVKDVTGKSAAERTAQRSYWTEHSHETTVEAMMLDSQAKIIDKEERPEVIIRAKMQLL